MAQKTAAQPNPIFLKIIRRLVLALLLVMLTLAAMLVWPTFVGGFSNTFQPEFSAAQSPGGSLLDLSPTANLILAEAAQIPHAGTAGTSQQISIPFAPLESGLIILSLNQGGYHHLYAAQWQGMPLTRLTDGAWQDIHPAINPTNNWLAFTSNRDGPWDIYQMDLSSGETVRLTNTPQYDGSPSWSPDGRWLVYESYVGSEIDGNLELFIQPQDGSQAPIQLTADAAVDRSPSWSPGGRQIAFISTRSGESEVWLADLDNVEQRFRNLSQNASSSEDAPVWSPDGSRLAWSGRGGDGLQNLFVWDASLPENRAVLLGSGAWSAWDPSGAALLAILETPNQSYLSAYSLADRSLAFPSLPLPGAVAGVCWGKSQLPEDLPTAFSGTAHTSPTPVWTPLIETNQPLPGNRFRLVPLNDVEAATPMLQDAADDAFQALRQKTAQLAGWDFLASLEQTFIPLSEPSGPAAREDWLYTGRAFRFNQAPVSAGWVRITREDYGAQTYWRVFLRTRYQDGSQGKPLSWQPWDFQARFSGDAKAYELGGALEPQAPAGYWLDFTSLALAYGWERQPAAASWRTAYSALRYNEFVLRQGLDWLSAMSEIYPRQALDTPTPVPPPTHTPTITQTPTSTLTPTRTPYFTRTPRPTSTPWPTRTPVPTRTPKISPTPSATPGQ